MHLAEFEAMMSPEVQPRLLMLGSGPGEWCVRMKAIRVCASLLLVSAPFSITPATAVAASSTQIENAKVRHPLHQPQLAESIADDRLGRYLRRLQWQCVRFTWAGLLFGPRSDGATRSNA